MAETKTKPTAVSVDEFIANVEDERKHDDSRVLAKLMSKATGAKAHMWGPTIVGFGTYHYKYDSGHEGDACIAGSAQGGDLDLPCRIPRARRTACEAWQTQNGQGMPLRKEAR